MIDKDKYEGHTPAPWLATHDTLESEMGWVINHDGWRVWVGEKDTDVPHLQNNRFGSENLSEADAQLIADAPLLLAEVERLREELAQTRESLWWCYDNYRFDSHSMVDADWNFIGNLLGADMESEEQ